MKSKPNKCYHTTCPSAYVAWHEWAEQKAKTHECLKCPACGLWAIWIRKKMDEKQDTIIELLRENAEQEKEIESLKNENEMLLEQLAATEEYKQELRKANNEFGSETECWPDLWRRISELKRIHGQEYRDRLEAEKEIESLRDVIAIQKRTEAAHTKECNRLLHEINLITEQRNMVENKAIKYQGKIESLRFQLNDERKHSDIILQQRDEAIGDLSQAKEDIESLRDQVRHEAERAEVLQFAGVQVMKDRDEWKQRADIIRRWSRNFNLLGGFTVWDKFLMENLEAADWFKGE